VAPAVANNGLDLPRRIGPLSRLQPQRVLRRALRTIPSQGVWAQASSRRRILCEHGQELLRSDFTLVQAVIACSGSGPLAEASVPGTLGVTTEATC